VSKDSDYIIRNIDFSMAMEDLPLTMENKEEMQKCIEGKLDLDNLIAETIRKYTAKTA
jgi:hypothetical protein